MSAVIEVKEPATPTPPALQWQPEAPSTKQAASVPEPHVAVTTSIQKVLASLAIGLVIAVVLGAKGIVHAGNGMEDGWTRNVTLAVGNAALDTENALHLAGPWDQAQIALGHAQQPAVPPLLASGLDLQPPATAVPRATERVGGKGVPPPNRGIVPPSATPTESMASHRGPSSGPTYYPHHRVVAAWPIKREASATPTATSTPTPTATARPRRRMTPRAHHLVPRPHGVGTPVNRRPTAIPTAIKGGTPHPHHHPRHVLPPTPTATAIPQLRPLTAARPLRLLITGDSLTGYLGPVLVDEAASAGPVYGMVDTHNGTGLTRPDFVDWSVVAQQQVAADNPDAVVVMMGGNDFQNMTLPNGAFFEAGTPAWTREYQRRAAICMRIWSQNGKRRVYWLSMPPARDPSWAYDDGKINIALQRAAATVPGAEYLNILGPVTDDGRYTDFIYDHGQPVLIREQDGVHLNLAGSTIVAHEVLTILEHEWHFGLKSQRTVG